MDVEIDDRNRILPKPQQVNAGRCDAPCNPDKASCFLFTCCGDRNGTLFTVSFAREPDVVLRVLRQLAFDYRTSSPTFKGKIEGALVDASPLRVVVVAQGQGKQGHEQDQPPPCFLAAPPSAADDNNCGNGWVSFENSCYQLHWAQPVSQEEARRQCGGGDGSSLVVPKSPAQNAFVAGLQGGCHGWLGLRRQRQGWLGHDAATWTTMDNGNTAAWDPATHYHNWTAGGAGAGDDDDAMMCAQLRPDGGWVRAPCHQGVLHHYHHYSATNAADCFVCRKPRAAAENGVATAEQPVSLSSQTEEDKWRLVECPQQGEAGDGGMGVRLQHEASGRFLGCSRESGLLVLLRPGEDEARATFVAHVDADGDGGFTLTQGPLAVVALLDDNTNGDGDDDDAKPGRLVCRPEQDWRGAPAAAAAAAAVRFEPTCMLRALAWRYLRLSVVVLSNDLNIRGRRECSVAAYDTSPATVSYRCRPLAVAEGGRDNDDELWLEQQALLVTDWQRWLLPRYPLPLGRLRCANEHPRQSAICTIAYGRGVTMARAVTLDWNTLVFNTLTTRRGVEVGLSANFPLPSFARGAGTGGDGGDEGSDSPNAVTFQSTALKRLENDLTVALLQFFEVAIVRAYVETRNWQTSIRARPLSSVTIQLWLEEVRLTYRWRALLQARGSFRVRYFGRPVGGQRHHALGDVLNYDDVFFFVFGRYEVPQEASMILTIDDRDESRWPLELLPETSLVEEPWSRRRR